MRCVACGGALKIVSRTHRYVESGLSNVTLHGVEVRKCGNCGKEEVAIPNIAGLHACIARLIAARRSAMTRQELRFLRLFLGRSSREFAKILDVAPETVSRWENGERDIPRSVDLVVRLVVMHSVPRTDYTDEMLAKIKPTPARPPKVTLRLRGNAWQPALAA